MATISEALAMAVQHQQAGRLQAAEQIYRQILRADPNQADALHLLGVLAYQMGKHEIAAEYIGRAIGFNGNAAAFHNNLGEAYRAMHRLPEAIACYRRALDLQPDFAEAHNNLGNALSDQGKLDDAVARYRRALELKPDYAEAHNNLGLAFKGQGKLEEAVACYRRAMDLKPDYAAAHSHLGNALTDQGMLDEAVACCRRALELKPDYAEAHNHLGNAFRDQGKLDEAVVCYCRALELRPDYAEAHNNLGVAFMDQRKLDEAVACCRRALELKPDYAAAHNNLGLAFKGQGKLEEAVACFRQAVDLKPDYAEAHLNRSLLWLLSGTFAQAWPEYAWRWQTKGIDTRRRFAQPLWGGESLAGKTVLLHAEQGLGDTIQFIRYASVVKQQGGTVFVECPKPLLGLLEGCAGVDQLIGQGHDLPAFDVHAPLLSVPGILKTSLETIPAKVPYLFPKPVLLEQWRKRLILVDGFKIGIAWQGNPKYRDDRWRSIPLRCFAPLAQIPGVRLIGLQTGVGTEQLAEVRDLFAVTELAGEVDQQSGPFMDTAAVMKNLELVITSDTALAHLAGALGVPVWVALPFAPDWRWLLARSDSPWYPTMRLFRQPSAGDWEGIFGEMHRALRE